jgi:hypothetical protein
LKYLSIASEKVNYLAFYDRGVFVGIIPIERVIKGLASSQSEFTGFKYKLYDGDWERFPGLITDQQSFQQTPTIRELYQRLSGSQLGEIPLIEGGRLKAMLNYETVSSALYQQSTRQSGVEM